MVCEESDLGSVEIRFRAWRDEILRKIRYIDGITQSETNIYLATRRNAGQRIRMVYFS
jgi:hypothetical protein